MKKIVPFLWFAGRTEEAMDFYTSIFPDSKIFGVVRHTEKEPGPADQALRGAFQIAGEEFYALEGTTGTVSSPALSLYVRCDDQDEIDEYWEKLSADGGTKGRSGWLRDKFGVSWQIAPADLDEMLGDHDREKAARAMRALLAMDKIDIDALRDAFEGEMGTGDVT